MASVLPSRTSDLCFQPTVFTRSSYLLANKRYYLTHHEVLHLQHDRPPHRPPKRPLRRPGSSSEERCRIHHDCCGEHHRRCYWYCCRHWYCGWNCCWYDRNGISSSHRTCSPCLLDLQPSHSLALRVHAQLINKCGTGTPVFRHSTGGPFGSKTMDQEIAGGVAWLSDSSYGCQDNGKGCATVEFALNNRENSINYSLLNGPGLGEHD